MVGRQFKPKASSGVAGQKAGKPEVIVKLLDDDMVSLTFPDLKVFPGMIDLPFHSEEFRSLGYVWMRNAEGLTLLFPLDKVNIDELCEALQSVCDEAWRHKMAHKDLDRKYKELLEKLSLLFDVREAGQDE